MPGWVFDLYLDSGAVDRFFEQREPGITPGPHRFIAHFRNEIKLGKSADCGRRIRNRCGQVRFAAGHAGDEQRPIEKCRQHKIRERPGEHNGNALPHRFIVEGARLVCGFRAAIAFIGHFHVTAERQHADHPFGLIAPEFSHPQGSTKTNRKTHNFHVAPARGPVVTKFVDSHQDADGQ